MDCHKLFLFFHAFLLFSLLLLVTGVQVQGSFHDDGGHVDQHRPTPETYCEGSRPRKLFVFGDSYADTGNFRKSEANSWKEPYGITFPGKPAGRFSDGRVLTDFIAKFLGMKSPIPYRWMKYAPKRIRYGLNFAFGGTGVFDTAAAAPNMTTQINFLSQLVKKSVYTKADLQCSTALVSVAGNDYGAYYAKGGSPQGLQKFITSVVSQLSVNLKTIHQMGVKKVAVTALEPLGCLPSSTVLSSYQQCNATENQAVNFHNLLLQQAVAKLNNETKDSTFIILNLYDAFISVLKNKGIFTGGLKSDSPLKPCCVGIGSGNCGSVDDKGRKLYTVCNNPDSTFFWDDVHPSQAGWRAIYSTLLSTLKNEI